jgi:hypothetical protein
VNADALVFQQKFDFLPATDVKQVKVIMKANNLQSPGEYCGYPWGNMLASNAENYVKLCQPISSPLDILGPPSMEGRDHSILVYHQHSSPRSVSSWFTMAPIDTRCALWLLGTCTRTDFPAHA